MAILEVSGIRKSFGNTEVLKDISFTMEKGDVPLEESLKLFQEGTELVRGCTKLLDEAELQITKITAGADGAPVEEPFDDEI